MYPYPYFPVNSRCRLRPQSLGPVQIKRRDEWNHICRQLGALGKNAKELAGFRRALQVEVMLADDALGIARLQRGLTHRPKLADEHRNERVPQHVMREPEISADFPMHVHRVFRDKRELLQWVGS